MERVQNTTPRGFMHHLPALAAGLLAGIGFYIFPAQTFFKYGAAALAGLAVLFNPLAGLYLLAGLLPFLPNLSLLLLAILTAFSFLLYRLRTKEGFHLAPFPIQPALSVFLFVIVFYSLTSLTPGGSTRELGLYLSALALMIILFNHIQKKDQLYVFLVLSLLAAFIVSLYGIYQYIIGVPVQAAWVDVEHHPLLQTRVYSVFGNPNVLAEYLILIIPFGLALFLTARNTWKKLLFLCITAAMGITMLMTFSRGGWMGLAVAITIFALLRDRRVFVLLFLLVLAAVVYMPDVVLQRAATMFSVTDSSNLYRITVWQESLNIARDYWSTGVGFGHKAFQEIYPYYMITRVKAPFHVHNTFLQYLVETGVLGLMALLWLLASIFKQGLKGLQRLQDGFLRHVLMASLAATAGILAHGLGEHVLYLPKIIFLFWINVGIIFLCIRLDSPKSKKTVESRMSKV